MPRRKTPPKYSEHKPTGQARVRIKGKSYYLGKYGSSESHKKYQEVLHRHWSGEVQEPALKLDAKPMEPLSVKEIAVRYSLHAKDWYRKDGKQTSEWPIVQLVMRELIDQYGDVRASEFGPLRFQSFRERFINRGLARTTINHYMKQVRLMLKFAVANELLDPMVSYAIRDVRNLQAGRSKARETNDVLPVDDKVIDATVAELTPTVAAMVRIQRLTGMRPGEVCMMRPCDIDRSDEIWIYRPLTHKNAHRKKQRSRIRLVAIGRKGQEILMPYLFRSPNAFLFTPQESYEQRQEIRRRQRTTPSNQGNRAGYSASSRKGGPGRKFRQNFNTNSYRNAIQRAAYRAFPRLEGESDTDWKNRVTWHPNQIRHTTATFARAVDGLETSQQVAGHASRDMTERYAEIDISKARDFARKYG